jgi:translation initiation factor 3 subunit C
MDEEFTKILQNADAHSQDYVERLKDELRVCAIIDRLKIYLESKANNNVMINVDSPNGPIPLVQPQHLCTAYMSVIEHLYYKYDKTSGQPSVAIMDRLCKYIYAKDALNRARARASLCHVYHLALHDHYYEARDLMLMCHMQDTITASDVATQILYNRTIVQLGLCAFRFGAVREAHQALVDMQSGNRAKELLAQGVQMIRNQERTRDQEMKERQRLLPFHMHINLELIECVYLVSAMLIEIPFMACKSLLFDLSEKNIFLDFSS